MNKTALVVEDDRVCQKVAKIMLEKLSFSVDIAGTAKEALEKTQQKYDVIFADLGLPDMDGIELIKRLFSQQKNTKIIALTGQISSKTQQMCLKIGCEVLLQKPILFEHLVKITETISQ